VQALFKKRETDPGCQQEVKAIYTVTIRSKITKGKLGEPLCPLGSPQQMSALYHLGCGG